jgi:hypothetical protein
MVRCRIGPSSLVLIPTVDKLMRFIPRRRTFVSPNSARPNAYHLIFQPILRQHISATIEEP